MGRVRRCRSRSCRRGNTERWSATPARSGLRRLSPRSLRQGRSSAKLKLSMGGSATPRERHTVGEVVAGYVADGAARLLLRPERSAQDPEGPPPAVGAFDRAVRYGWMVANPCPQATKPKVDTEEIEPPPSEWVRGLVVDAEAVNADLAVCLRLAAATGARRGELVAVQWADLKADRLTIRRSLVESEGKLFERRTKTGTKGHRDDRGGRGDDASDRCAARPDSAPPPQSTSCPPPSTSSATTPASLPGGPTTSRSPTAGCPGAGPAARPAPLPRDAAPRRRRAGDDREQTARPHQHGHHPQHVRPLAPRAGP